MTPLRSKRGLALLVVVGVLGILTVLGAAFVTLAQLERRASRQRLFATKALLLARSGIEDALARLDGGQDPDAAGSRYGGEDWDASGTLNGFEGAAEASRPGSLDTDACPVGQALRPSFFARSGSDLGADLLPAPARVQVEGRPRGYSGALAGDLGAEGNPYAVRVHTEGGLYLNGGDPSVPVDPGVDDYNLNLRRMLGILAEAVDREDGVAGDGPVSQADGFSLIDARPPTALGWESWEQVRDIALGGSRAKLEVLRPYLTLSAWVDRKVIRPNAVPAMEGQSYQSWADIKLAHETYPGMPGTKEPGFETVPVAPGGKLVGRAPVDLAWARTRRPVLIALLAGLKGLPLEEAGALPIDNGDLIGTMSLPAEIALDWGSPADDCRRVADQILAFRGELRTWEQWDAFCDAVSLMGPAQRDLLKANFNPNSRLNKSAPNASLWRSVDKSDLLAYSTEFSLLPRACAQELESVGRILGKGGRLLASRVLRASIAPADRVSLTTQKEFVCEDPGDLSIAGDEQALRQPGYRVPGKAPFVTEGQGAGGRTWGHRLDVTGTYPGSWMDGDSAGASLQTYPEPCVEAGPAGTGLSTRAADYDGSIQLATVETPAEECYGVAAPTRDMKLLARYTKDFDLDVSDAAPTRPPGDPRWQNQPDIGQVTYNAGGVPDPSELGHGLWDPSRPNTLYPDGVYSEKDRAPSYLDRGNADGFHGVLSFWVRANHAADVSDCGHPFFKWTNFKVGMIGGNSADRFFYLGTHVSESAGPVCQFEVGHSTEDENMEHRFEPLRALMPRRWSLITMYYDFRSPTNRDCGELLLDAGREDADRGSEDVYFYPGNDPDAAADITEPDIFGDHRLVLGKGQPEIEEGVIKSTRSGADATFDELAIYDFGGAKAGGAYVDQAATLGSPGLVAANRFREGRYYRESAYPASGGLRQAPGPLRRSAAEYFSPPIRLGPCRIRALSWTQVVPRGLGAPLPAGGQAGVDGDPGDDGRIVLELSNVGGRDYPRDTTGVPIDRTFDLPASSPVDRTVNAPFRLHAVFQPNLDDPDNTPILDPLALDDVTVLYEPLGGARISGWREGDAP